MSQAGFSEPVSRHVPSCPIFLPPVAVRYCFTMAKVGVWSPSEGVVLVLRVLGRARGGDAAFVVSVVLATVASFGIYVRASGADPSKDRSFLQEVRVSCVADAHGAAILRQTGM